MARQQRWEGEEVGAVLSWLNQVPAAAHEVDTASGLCCPRGTEHALFTEEGFVHIGTHLRVTAPPPPSPSRWGTAAGKARGCRGTGHRRAAGRFMGRLPAPPPVAIPRSSTPPSCAS